MTEKRGDKGQGICWREPVDLTWVPPVLPPLEKLESWLADQEARVPALRSDAAKRILWAAAPGTQTELALVYIHGFSAAAPELRPVPDLVAKALGANLFFTRLAGHGRDSAAMAEPCVADWARDLAEAIAIGRLLGRHVILMGSSMGGALASLAAFDPAYGRNVAGLILVAPAFRLPGLAGRIVTWPLVRHWGPRLFGATRTSPPRSPRHAAAWTLSYPMTAVLPLGALVRRIGQVPKATAALPALIFYAEEDQVVDPAAVRAAARDWGAGATLLRLTMGPKDDRASHVIAGDILSPGQTEILSKHCISWVRSL